MTMLSLSFYTTFIRPLWTHITRRGVAFMLTIVDTNAVPLIIIRDFYNQKYCVCGLTIF